MTTTDTTFNAEFAELIWGEADSVQRRLEQLASDHRASARAIDPRLANAKAQRLEAAANAYEHAASMIDLAFEQALARVARQASA